MPRSCMAHKGVVSKAEGMEATVLDSAYVASSGKAGRAFPTSGSEFLGQGQAARPSMAWSNERG